MAGGHGDTGGIVVAPVKQPLVEQSQAAGPVRLIDILVDRAETDKTGQTLRGIILFGAQGAFRQNVESLITTRIASYQISGARRIAPQADSGLIEGFTLFRRIQTKLDDG